MEIMICTERMIGDAVLIEVFERFFNIHTKFDVRGPAGMAMAKGLKSVNGVWESGAAGRYQMAAHCGKLFKAEDILPDIKMVIARYAPRCDY